MDLRLKNLDGSDGPDAKRVEELRVGAKGRLIATAGGYTPEKVLTSDQRESILCTLKTRFTCYPDFHRHRKDIQFPAVQKALEAEGDKVLYGLFQMEENGHEVSVTRVEKDGRKGFRFDSCSNESPAKIRDIDYFRAKEIAVDCWGVDLMDPEVFDALRKEFGFNRDTFDHLKTDDSTLEDGSIWQGGHNGIYKVSLRYKIPICGFRCSVWIPEVS